MNDDVLLAYARAMRSAQRLESRVKILLYLHKMLPGVSKTLSPPTDDEFESLLADTDKLTFGTALHSVFQMLTTLGFSTFPEQARQALWHTVQVRNFIAHHYFVRRGNLVEEEDARPYLIAELEWCGGMFEMWVPAIDKWSARLLMAVDMTEEEREFIQTVSDETFQDLRAEQLKALRGELQRIGIDVPPLPEPAG